MASEASNLIEAAINEAMQTTEDYVEGDILVDWMVIGFTSHPDPEKGGSYPMFFSNGQMPGYQARGLLVTSMINLIND